MIALDSIANGLRDRIQLAATVGKVGHVVQAAGLIIESDGPALSLGAVCEIRSPRHGTTLTAEVVGFRNSRLLLMPFGEPQNVYPGSEVVASDHASRAPVGETLIGRILDGLGRPIDERGPLHTSQTRELRSDPSHPLRRQRITAPFQTGIKGIDLFTPMGCGQRMGIFAGSGVGKSTLLGMIARGAESEVNVIALIGERGRELREFIEKDLGPEGMARSVIVVATSDQPALVRIRAALLATTIAEYFRDAGRKVLFMMDSVTRFAMAQREVGLAVGEPPTSRGYTPSVFSMLPRLLERTGMGEQGSITALYTVLVDGDDFNEPIADAVRGILDGHVVLSRALATANHFPAIDVLESISRLTREVMREEDLNRVGVARDLLALYRKNEDLVNIGAYVKGTNPKVDRAIERQPALVQFLRQNFTEKWARERSLTELHKLL
ncbi:MAG: flagellum-specific synthase [Chthoniobacter sp.]|jgi:flagellum-specific ATP synthase|nr:flagellum-specific synthase [Chthoniobacter sp.]